MDTTNTFINACCDAKGGSCEPHYILLQEQEFRMKGIIHI